jgi:hypothetical protein
MPRLFSIRLYLIMAGLIIEIKRQLLPSVFRIRMRPELHGSIMRVIAALGALPRISLSRPPRLPCLLDPPTLLCRLATSHAVSILFLLALLAQCSQLSVRLQ